MCSVLMFSKELLKNCRPPLLQTCGNCLSRQLSYSPMIYGRDNDPAPTFIRDDVQGILRHLTRVDLDKVFRKRLLGTPYLSAPVTKFLTDSELQETQKQAEKRVFKLLQFPPVVCVRDTIDWHIANNPEIQGFIQHKHVFTDVTFGVHNDERLITVRTPDGQLFAADWDTRKRINQVYFPLQERAMLTPQMFSDDHPEGEPSYFEQTLDKKLYTYLLDRACVQFDPDEPEYQRIVSITYQYVNDHGDFEMLRSTRHFSVFAFFLAWHKLIDNLVMDLLHTEHIDELNSLMKLYGICHQIQMISDGGLSTTDLYLKQCSHDNPRLHLAVQAYKDKLKHRSEVEQGIKQAHGFV